MRKFFCVVLTLLLALPMVTLAAKNPQSIIKKPGAGEKVLNSPYSPLQQLGKFQGKTSQGAPRVSESTTAIYLSEGFEGSFPPTGWSLFNVGAGFQQTSSRVFSGSFSAFHDDDFGQQDDWLVTPAIDLTGSSAARLTFWQNDNFSSFAGLHHIYVTTDTTGVMGDTSAWTKVYDDIGAEDTWEQVIVDLSAYDGQTIFIGFYYSGDFADEWYIDDVVVEDAPTTPVMVTLFSELQAPPTPIDSTVSDTFPLITNTGGALLNYSISIDNPDFSVFPTSGEINPGDTLFVLGSFTPSSSGLITGQAIITGDDPDNPADTVALSGIGYPTTYVMEEFNSWPYTPYNFARIDNNGDGNTWAWFLLIPDSNLVAGIQWTAMGNDDYLVTPPLPVQAGDFIAFDSWAQSSFYPETWEVLVSTTDRQASSFTVGLDTVTSGSTEPITYFYDLSAFAGQTIFVAIRNISVDQFYQWVDNMIMPMPNYPVFINEVYYDSPGSDAQTFTELFGKPGMSLDGYSLNGVNGNGGATYATIDLTGNVIPDDAFFVIGQDATVDNVDLVNSLVNWQNGPDNVVLMNGADTVDALGYGNFDNAVFVGEGNPAVDVFGGVSLSRYPDGMDTDDNASDFHATYPTPGVPNDPPEPIIGGGSSLDFDTVSVGQSASMNYTIFNNGSDTLAVDSIVTSNTAFSVGWPTESVDTLIAPGSSATVSVTFAPSAAVSYNDSMIIYNNDPRNGERSVALTGVGELPSQNAVVVLAAQIGGDSQYRSFWVNGSWDASGNYDPMWSGPMVELNDNGQGADSVAGDNIFTGYVVLAVDLTNTYNWWTGSENDVNSFLEDGAPFDVTSSATFFTDTLFVDGDNGINEWVISLAGDFNGWNNASDDMTRFGTKWVINMPLDVGTYEYKYTVMHQWNAAYGSGGVGGAGTNYSYTVADSGLYTFTFDDADNSQSVKKFVPPNPPRNPMAFPSVDSIIVTWEAPLPPGQSELAYDDGGAEIGLGFGAGADGDFAVRFTPTSYPVTLLAIRTFWADGGGGELNNVTYSIYDGDASGPANLLSGPTPYTVTDRGSFSEIDISGLNLQITSGDFYYSFFEDATGNFVLGFDQTSSARRSWINSTLLTGGQWMIIDDFNPAFAGNFIIHAIVQEGSEENARIVELSPAPVQRHSSSNIDIPGLKRLLNLGRYTGLEVRTLVEPSKVRHSNSPAPGWTPPIEQTLLGYYIYRSEGTSPFMLFDSTNAATTTYTDTAVTFGTMYSYYLTAVYDVGESPPSDTVSATPLMALPELKEHVTPEFKSGVTNEGTIGMLGSFGGLPGFQWPVGDANNWLFEGAFMMGVPPDQVVDAARVIDDQGNQAELDADFQFTDKVNVIANNADSTVYATSYNDAWASQPPLAGDGPNLPIGLDIEQWSYSYTDTANSGYLLFKLTVTNTSGTQVDSLLIGMYHDWDIKTYNSNTGMVDFDTLSIAGVNNGDPFEVEFAYLYDQSDPTVYLGAVPLSQNFFRASRIVDNGAEIFPGGASPFTEANKYNYMLTRRANDPFGDPFGPEDKSLVVGLGGEATNGSQSWPAPGFSLADGESVTVGMAMVGGNSIEDFMRNARAAIKKWVELGNSIAILDTLYEVPTGISDNNGAVPTEFALEQNYPNPFNPSTTIRYALKENVKVKIEIYNILGQKVRTLVDGNQTAGYKKVEWDGLNDVGQKVSSGIYIYKMVAGDFVKSRKMILLK